MNQTLFLVRHCSATGQEPDAPLTETGVQQTAILAEWLRDKQIEAIFSSPFTRAHQSILPFAEQQKLPIQVDDRLAERVLCAETGPDWQKLLEQTFADPDLYLSGGETSRAAAARAMAVIDSILSQSLSAALLVTHGNLLTLILQQFDSTIGYSDWQRLTNPDVYRVTFAPGEKPVLQRVWE